ncbi:CCAAT-binding factor domain-containing protein [Plasmodiophora brassicae]
MGSSRKPAGTRPRQRNTPRSRKKLSSEPGRKNDDLCGAESDGSVVIGDEDMEFFAERSSFLGSLASCKLDQVQTPKQARVKRPRELSDNESDDAAERFERQPRVSSWSEPDLPQRLPVKSSDGRLMLSKVSQADKQSLQVKHGNKNDGSPVKVKEVLGEDEGPPPSTLKPQEPSETPQQRSQRLRIRIGVVCENICESPEENISLLDELFSMSKDSDPVIRELSILSQVAVFIDIAPGYQIRSPTESEKSGKLSKDVRRLWRFESALLSAYRRLVNHLIALTKRTQRHNNQPKHDRLRLGLAAGRGLCELLRSLPHFNLIKEIIVAVIPLVNHPLNDEISAMARDAVVDVIRQPAHLDHALECVRLIAKIVEQQQFKVRRELLQCLLSIPLRTVKAPEQKQPPSGRKKQQKKRPKVSGGSKNDDEDAGLESELKRDMDASSAVASGARHARTQQLLLELIFKTFFSLLKFAPESDVLPVVLEGLAKFAHLVNVELVLDLLTCLQDLMDKNVLALESTLHCIIAAFQMLCSQGTAIVIDARDFYRRLYCEFDSFLSPASWCNLPLLFDCLDLMFIKRRQISVDRVGAYVKKLCSLALHVPLAESMGVLHCVQRLLGRYPQCTRLLDNEPSTGGVYLPDAEDPEHANPFSSSLWELSLLQQSYQADLQKYASQIARQDAISVDKLRQTPSELMQSYKRVLCHPALPVPPAPSERKRIPRIRDYARRFSVQDAMKRLHVTLRDPVQEPIVHREFQRCLWNQRIRSAQAAFHQ